MGLGELAWNTPRPTTASFGRWRMENPICPNCKRNAWSPAMMQCTACGLPQEVVDMGHRNIARWRKMDARARGERSKVIIGGSAGRKKNKHGRKGAKK